ncbi:MAG TPA: POTRA domain-containing protein [Terriglobales bacterium]|nr:POTRA domain-containing protein [Terriglobales bacterium]
MGQLIRKSCPSCILVCGVIFLMGAVSYGQNVQTVKPPEYQNKPTPTEAPPPPRTAPQTQEVLPSYEGQRVSGVEIAGQPEVNTESLVPLLQQRAGQPFSQAKVQASIDALKNTHRFQDVTLEVRPDANGVRVLMILQPAVYFGIYDFPGALRRFPYSRLLQVTNYPPRGAYTPVDVQTGENQLRTFFRRTGFFQAQIHPEVRTDRQHGIANVIYRTDLGPRAKFGKVNIEGTTPEETQHLIQVSHSFLARMRNSAIRPGKTYQLKKLTNATKYLQTSLMKNGHLAAQVRLIGANYDPETRRADISFHVDTGPVVKVNVEGAHLWPWTRKKLLPVYQQIGVDPELIQEGRQNLISHFQNKGYFDVNVTTNVQQQPGGENIVYQIAKGPRHKVADVKVVGNQGLGTKELMQHLKVEKAHFLSHGDFSQKLVRSSVKNLTDLYKANGYSSVKVTPQVVNQNGNIVVTFNVNEGPQDIVQSIRIAGANTLPESKFAPHGLKLQPGKPYSQKLADEDRNEVMANYLRQGYLNATFREIAKANQPHRLDVVYQIEEGPQVHTATVVTLGREDTQQKLITRDVAEINPGQPLRADEMMRSETELYEPGIFDWAQVDPRRQITTQTQEDVLVKVHEAKRNVLTYGFGFEVINRGGSVPSGTVAVPGLPPVGLPSTFKTSQSTFWGPRGTIEYTRSNLRGKAESLTFSGLGARLEQRGSVVFSDPSFRWSSWATDVSLSGEHNSENPIYSSRIAQVALQFRRPLNKKKTRYWFVKYSLSETGLTHLLIPELVPSSQMHVRLSTFSTTYTNDTRDNVLDAHKGIYQSFEVDINPRVLSNFQFARFLGQTAYYKKIRGNIVWANSVRLGLEQSFGGSTVPLSQAFFSGGGSSLRGFPLNGAGPQRTIPACGNPAVPSTCSLITVPVGGNQLLILNSELRVPSPVDLPIVHKNLGFAVFYDGGNVFQSVGFHNFGAQYTNSIGAGLRYSTPVGPVRIDIGHNLNAPPGLKSTQVFVTLGQAF